LKLNASGPQIVGRTAKIGSEAQIRSLIKGTAKEWNYLKVRFIINARKHVETF
jgi:hypothetical protein